MRESIGGTWLMSIVIVFVVLFISFLAVSVNYSKAFKIKNGIINIIEKNQGLSDTAVDDINKLMSSAGYVVYGSCEANWKGCQKSNASSTKSKYCIAEEIYSKDDDNSSIFGKKSYYRVTVFFRIDLPVIGNLLTFPIKGETKAVYTQKTLDQISC